MPECTSIDPLVTPFVDGELTVADHQMVERHMLECPPCRSRIAAERCIHELLHERRLTLGVNGAPPALRARCTAAAGLPMEQPRARPAWHRRRAPLALAATLMLVGGGVALNRVTASSTRVLAAELAADHVKCFIVNAVLGSEQPQAEVEQSLAAGFGWNAHLPERPDGAGLVLVGARPCLYGQGRVAHVMYRHHGRPLSLFMLPEKQRAAELVGALGHEAAVWSTGDRTFVLVARESRAEVQRIASFMHATMR